MRKVYRIHDEKLVSIKESASCEITVILENPTVNLEYTLENGDYKIFVYRKSKLNKLNEKVVLSENSSLDMAYLDLAITPLIQNSVFDVNKHAILNVRTIYLADNQKQVDFNITNLNANSEVNISNSVVALKNADFIMNVIGNIKKGSKNAIHHQKNRCLTIDHLNKALIRPILNIDENDVQASHSLSTGTIDEDMLYYMNARGLNKHEALLLMIESYLSYETDFYAYFDLGQEIEEEAKVKVKNLCLM